LWRDTEGRGTLLHGALDGPQVAAVLMVLVGALVLLERKAQDERHLGNNDREQGTRSEAAHG